MRILFLHLSDLLIGSDADLDMQRHRKMLRSLAFFEEIDGVVLVISGDLATGGKRSEYSSVSAFVDNLMASVKEGFPIESKDLKILLVPGDHDIQERLINPNSIRKLSNIGLHSAYQMELDRMEPFFWFSQKYNCFFRNHFYPEENQVFTRKILHFSNGFRIEANLINSAPFSCEIDVGLHYLPPSALYGITRPSNADISIVIMHHSPEWFFPNTKKQISRLIMDRCSLALYGHGNITGAEENVGDRGYPLIKQSNCAWYTESEPTRCEFYAGLLNTTTGEYTLKRFRWSTKDVTFQSFPCLKASFLQKPLNEGRTSLQL